jgi:suppressor of fused-like protein
MSDKIKRTVVTNPDGSQTVSTSFDLTATRPVNDDVVTAIDDALHAIGDGEVMHAMDPTRLLPFSHGGPPVWSVAMVPVGGPRPYTLLVTYGFSEILSPEPERAGIRHEYSLAVPAGVPLSPWADAFLRHQCRYVLNQGADIRVGDCVPFNGVPMTRIPFQPAHHAMMPNSSLVGIVCTPDPVVPAIETAHGTIEVRRLVGLDQLELDRVETWSVRGFVEELLRRDPLLLSPPERPSWMSDVAFRTAVEVRAAEDGSEMDAALFDLAWAHTDQGIEIELPAGRAADRLREAICGRVGFGRRLVAISRSSPAIAFVPDAPPIQLSDDALIFGGDMTAPMIRTLLAALDAGQSQLLIRLNNG